MSEKFNQSPAETSNQWEGMEAQKAEVAQPEMEAVTEIEATKLDDSESKETAAEIIECIAPDGTHFKGTREEFNDYVKDYLDNIA